MCAAQRHGCSVVNTDITVKGGRFTTVYAGNYTGEVTGDAKAVLTDCRVYRVVPSYSGKTQCDVYMELRNVTIGKELCYGHRNKNDVTGNVTLVLGEGVTAPENSIYAGSRDGGNVLGTVTVIADGIDLTTNAILGKAYNSTGTIGGLKLILNQGELADVADSFITRDGVQVVFGCHRNKTATLPYACSIDLNGYDAMIDMANGKTLTVKDSKTDDYTVTDGIYGKLTVTGYVKPQNGYLKVNKDGYLSFHKYDLAITTVILRPSVAGIYFGSSLNIDEKVPVVRKGIAVSVYNEQPVADGSDVACLWTTGYTSVLVANILKSENGQMTNARNGITSIFARAYIELEDGTYIYSDTVDANLKEVVQTVDEQLDTLTDIQKTELNAMYASFRETMDLWDLPNLKKQWAS